MITVVLNGEERQISSETVEALLCELALQNKKIAVEVNREIVPRVKYPVTSLVRGDKVEIVHFVGGG